MKIHALLVFFTQDGDEIGSVRQTGNSQVNYASTSDIRLKTAIQPTQYSIEDILNIEVKDYEYKDEPGKIVTGFLAQQLYTIVPNAVTVGGEDEKTDPWMVDYGRMTPYLVKALQDQQAQIEKLKAENVALKTQMARIDQLEAMILNLKLSPNIDSIESQSSKK